MTDVLQLFFFQLQQESNGLFSSGGGLVLGHLVQSRTVLEPLDLVSVVSVGKLRLPSLTVLGLDNKLNVLARGKLAKTKERDSVRRLDSVVVLTLNKVEGQKTLLLQVGLVDTGKGLGNDGKSTKVTGLKSSVLSGRSLTKVLTTDNDPADTLISVRNGSLGDTIPLTSVNVLNVVGLTVGSVGSTNHVVVGNVLEVTSVLQPRTGHGNVVSGGLTKRLDKDGHVNTVSAVPRLERRKELETVRLGVDSNLDRGTVLRRVLVSVHTGVVTLVGETETSGLSELELLALRVLEGISEGVESQVTGNGKGCDKIGGGNKGVGSGVGVVTGSEVTVVRRDNSVLVTLLNVLTVPLTNAGTTGVGKDETTKVKEGLELTVTLNGGTDLLGTGGDGVDGLGLETVGHGVTGNRGRALHVLVRGVGARADKTDLDLKGPVLLNGNLLELGDGGGQIGSEGTVDVGLKSVEVNLNELVVLGTSVSREKVLMVEVSKLGDGGPASGVQVVGHGGVVGEDRGGSTNLGTHVANGTHTSARKSVNTLTKVLNNGTGTTLDGKDTSELEDNILGGGPARELTSELDTDNLGGLELPGEVSHDIDGISTTDTNGELTKTTSVGGVGVGTNQESTGESVVLKNDLVDNSGTGAPETNVVLGSGGGKEIVDLLVDVNGTGQILGAADLSLNQMVTVDGGGGGNRGHTSRHELENGHLGGSVLAGNTVRAELEVRDTTLNVLLMGLVKMSVENLLGVSQGSVESLSDNVDVLGVLLVVDEGVVFPDVLENLGVAGNLRVRGRGETSGGTEGALNGGISMLLMIDGWIGCGL